MKQEEMDRQYQRENSITAKIKRWGDCLKNSLYAMPQDSIEIVNWFQNLEQLYRNYEVPNSLKVDLMRPYLNHKAKTLLSRLQPTELTDYEFVKRALLREFQLDAQSYLHKFNTITMQDGETYSSFVGRVRALLMYYIESRHVKTNDHELLNLLVSDRIKAGLDSNTLRHILAVEAATTDGWLPPEKLVAALEAYRANYSSDGRPRSGAIGIAPRIQNRPMLGLRSPVNGQSVNAGISTSAPRGFPGPAAASNTVQRCYVCDSPFHKAIHCPHRIQGPRHVQVRAPVRAPPPVAASRAPRPATVSRCKTESVIVDDACPGVKPVLPATVGLSSVVRTPVDTKYWPDSGDMHDDSKTTETCTMNMKCGNDVFVTNVNSTNVSTVDGINALDYMPIKIRGVSDTLSGLIDSGSMIYVVNGRIVSELDLPRVGSVSLRGIIGSPVKADLVRLDMGYVDSDHEFVDANTYHTVLCAVCDDINDDLVLTAAVVRQLVRDQCVNVPPCILDDVMGDDVNVENVKIEDSGDTICTDVNANDITDMPVNANVESGDENLPTSEAGKANRETLIAEQQADKSLAICWSLAKQGKGNFIVENGVLYRDAKILGHKFRQLCLPEQRRRRVLELAHDRFGGHLASKKTTERIALTFYWPKMKETVQKYISECVSCQTRAPITFRDRVPITPVPRADRTFSHWVIDCAGPFSSHHMEYPYALLMVDSASRWPAAYPLRSLTAKSVSGAYETIYDYRCSSDFME